jgi:uracil-DNA glycosylase
MNFELEPSWKTVLSAEFNKPYFSQLTQFLNEEKTKHSTAIFPEENSILTAFSACPFDQVKVVVLGQDPYPTRGHAHGLSFSVNESVKPFPKSLTNIFKELQADLQIPFPENGNLMRWALQGVLLLNATLTVEEGKPESHAQKGWEIFTDAVISALTSNKESCVYLLWGTKAQQKAQFVDRQKNLVLTAPHPSPLAAYRGFFGCKHFSQTNDYLVSIGSSPIIW